MKFNHRPVELPVIGWPAVRYIAIKETYYQTAP